MSEIVIKFIELSKNIEQLWDKFSSINDELDQKYIELDNLLNSLNQNSEDLLVLEDYVNSKSDNYFEKLLLSRYFIFIGSKKGNELLKYVASHGNGMSGFLAKSALLNLK